MSAIRARTLDDRLDEVFSQADTTIYLREAWRAYEDAIEKALQWIMIIGLGIGSLAHSWTFRNVRRRGDIHEEMIRNAVIRKRAQP